MRYHLGIGCSFGTSSHSSHQALAEKLNAKFINLSDGGKGNFRIYTELLQWTAANSAILQDTTISIGWSGIWRNDVIVGAKELTTNIKQDISYKWLTWRSDRDNKTLRNMPRDMEIDLDHKIRFYTYVIGAQNLLKNLGVNYVMYNSLDPKISESVSRSWSKVRLRTLERQIDMNRFYRFTSSQSEFIAGSGYFLDPSPVSLFRRLLNLKQKWKQTEMHKDGYVADAHPSPEGDRKWAELVWQFSKQNQLL